MRFYSQPMGQRAHGLKGALMYTDEMALDQQDEFLLGFVILGWRLYKARRLLK